jgi:D-glycero-alpha-D-manno-heptose-7-phosphate kinase
MIISKTPFRVSLFGGSTDYKSYYEQHGSLLIGFAMDKYCYLSLRENPEIFSYKSKISYSKIEQVNDNKEIQHDGVRGALEYFQQMDKRWEMSYFSDFPAQTGTGSSSAFMVGLINALKSEYNYSPYQLAKFAIEVERNHLKEPGGIQDQIWAAYGGFNSVEIKKDGDFRVRPLPISKDFIEEFFNRSFLIYTGKQRRSFRIASSSDTGSSDENKINIHKLANDALRAFSNEDIESIAILLRQSWESKIQISPLIAGEELLDTFRSLYAHGMIGGKLLGSGGSGFIFGIAKDSKSKKDIVQNFSGSYIDCGYSPEGSKIIHA